MFLFDYNFKCYSSIQFYFKRYIPIGIHKTDNNFYSALENYKKTSNRDEKQIILVSA